MPLSPAVERERFHTRAYEVGGFRRADGLWDIEARITDVKSYSFENRHRGTVQAGEPLHDMHIRLTLDEDMIVQAIEATTEAGPFAACPAVTPNFARMIGVRVGAGWRRAIRERLGGTNGCTHLNEMLGLMATVAFQTLFPVLAKKAEAGAQDRKPALIDSCYAYRSDGEVVKANWPAFYSGK